MKNVRLKQMEQFFVENKFATIEEISERFHIHPNTARSDIKTLAERGVVRKQYGGVEYITPELQTSFSERNTRNMTIKEVIGNKASELLEEDDVIFVDTGSTTARLLQAGNTLPKHLTVISSSLEVLETVSASTDYTLFVLPGQFNRQINGFVGLETIESLKTYHIKKGFIGARGVSAKGELTTDSSIDAKIKSMVLEVCETIILMADKRKMEQTALFSFARLRDVDYWVCEGATPLMEKLSQKNGFKLLQDELLYSPG